MNENKVVERLGLTSLRDRKWYIQSACATTGEGLGEGLTWLAQKIK